MKPVRPERVFAKYAAWVLTVGAVVAFLALVASLVAGHWARAFAEGLTAVAAAVPAGFLWYGGRRLSEAAPLHG